MTCKEAPSSHGEARDAVTGKPSEDAMVADFEGGIGEFRPHLFFR